MAEDAAVVAPQKLAIGSVIGRTLGIFFRNFFAFGLLAVVIYIPSMLLQFEWLSRIEQNPTQVVELSSILVLAQFGLGIVLWAILAASLTYGTIMDLRHGGKPGMFLIIRKGVSLAIPVLLISVSAGFLMLIGFAVFVIPGVILATMWFVCIPAAVVEREGFIASFRRSVRLTRGYRWPVFGTIILLYIVQMIVGAIVAIILGVIGIAFMFGAEGGGQIVEIVLTTAVQGITMALLAIGSAVTYHDLRIMKEGGDVDQIAAVFD